MNVELTEAGRNKLHGHYPQGIPYQIPHEVDGKPTIRRVCE
ncbi:MAG: hypothetical protein NWE89_01345 [Candidatus Bathyarchaeota archaeon]|nr:hypothetical protein [Candidatus Bathyarchaeota archaeon]